VRLKTPMRPPSLSSDLKPSPNSADLTGALARGVRVQQSLHARAVNRLAGVGRPQACGINLNDNATVFTAAVRHRVGGVLNELGDLAVGVTACQDGQLDVGVFFCVVRRGAISAETFATELSGISDKGAVSRQLLRLIRHPL